MFLENKYARWTFSAMLMKYAGTIASAIEYASRICNEKYL